MAAYKLRCNLLGHSKDVRAVAASPEGLILTGSRDNTARLWGPMENGVNYEQKQVFSGHSGYVTSVCIVPGNPSHPEGLVVTGSRDSTILVYSLSGGQPQYTLTGHSDTVSSLEWKNGILISGSWDHSARIWKNWECVHEMKGHEGPIWSVVGVPRSGAESDQEPVYILTASADKFIKLWKDGKACRTYSGHKDCVRGLAVVNSEKFLSCSNDASVILWAVSGECLSTYYGHTNFIYSISVIGTSGFVTGGEDRTLRVWDSEGNSTQTIHVPAQSVWAVASFPNSDIICGSSDGTCRIFTAAAERQADPADQKEFEESVAKSTMAVGDLGGVKKSELPGREALFAPGKRDGHTIMVREGEKVNCYSWSVASQQWQPVGEVVGGAGGSQGTSGKVLHEGKEYDFVFDVELDQGNRLKLPYNLSEDPYFAAQRFIHRHELPQEFLDQVASFIINNTKGMTLGVEGNTEMADPFTGGSRYVPGGASGSTSGGSDPFTGGGRYVPGAASGPNTGSNTMRDPFTGASSYSTQGPAIPSSHFFPQLVALKFEACNASGMTTKLLESNGKLNSDAQIAKESLEQLVGAVTGTGDANPQLLAPLEKALQWPAEHVWPALDVLRLALRSEQMQKVWLEDSRGEGLVSLLVTLIQPSTPATAQLLAFRCLANMASHETGRCVLARMVAQVVSATVGLSPYPNKNMEIAASTVLLNYSVIFNGSNNIEDQCQILSGTSVLAISAKDPEAQFRTLVALGTLLTRNDKCRSFAGSLDLKPVVKGLSNIANPSKVGECAGHVLRML